MATVVELLDSPIVNINVLDAVIKKNNNNNDDDVVKVYSCQCICGKSYREVLDIGYDLTKLIYCDTDMLPDDAREPERTIALVLVHFPSIEPLNKFSRIIDRINAKNVFVRCVDDAFDEFCSDEQMNLFGNSSYRFHGTKTLTSRKQCKLNVFHYVKST